MHYMKENIVILVIVTLVFLGIDLERRGLKEDLLEYNLGEVERNTDAYLINKIYVVDLVSREYRDIELSADIISDNKNHVDISFLTTKANEKIAEILIDPSEERIVIKCLKSYCKIALYEPNMKKLYIFTEYVSTIKWSEYEINYINEEIKSRIINNTYCFL